MKKFFIISLGVLSWFNSVAVQAVEKFEILPDLPESLVYAGQSAQAATISGAKDVASMGSQSIGNEPSLISVIL